MLCIYKYVKLYTRVLNVNKKCFYDSDFINKK